MRSQFNFPDDYQYDVWPNEEDKEAYEADKKRKKNLRNKLVKNKKKDTRSKEYYEEWGD